MADSKKYNGSTWEHSLRKLTTATDTITTLPAMLYPNDTTATVGLKGNTVQSGTPTPDNPITPKGCGERTGNLLPLSDKTFTITAANSNLIVTCSNGNLYFSGVVGEISSGYTAWKTNFAFELEAGTYYCNDPSPLGDGFGRYIRKYSDDTSILIPYNYTFTLSETTKCYLGFYIVNKNLDTQLKLMLNLGSTALPYEPWGVKIPILNNSTTYNKYLGEVETTRQVKKVVLTGEESTYTAIDSTRNIFTIRGVFNQAPELLQVGGFCTHYKYNNAISSLAQNMSNGDFVLNKITNDYSFTIRDNSFPTQTEFQQYVQQQYAAGTPVCVWYVLSTPQTAVVNEPLMKIGNYVDEVSNVSIPVTAGGDTISVDTTVQPSEVTVNYTGWHDATVKEWDSSQWNE